MGTPAMTGDAEGCPSGLQDTPVSETDPLGAELDLTRYVTSPQKGLSALELSIRGAHCAGCVSKIERGLSGLDGIKQARMNLTNSRLNITWAEEKISPKEIVTKVTGLGFGVAPFEYSQTEIHYQKIQKSLLRYIAVAGFAAMNIMLLSIAVWSGGADMTGSTRHLFHWLSAIIALPTVAYAGRVFFTPALTALKNRRTNMDVPISLALILACALSVYETVMGHKDIYFDAAVMLLLLLLIGRYLDTRLRLKTGEAARRLSSLQVTSATRLMPGGGQETIPAQALKIGERILIPAGQRIAIDCRVETGTSDIDMKIATGETAAMSVGPGDSLLSGTVNLSDPLTAIVIAGVENSFLAEITNLVEIGEQSKSRYVRIADRAARAYVPVVHSVALLTFLGWFYLSGDLRMAAINAIAVLIITCPCALGLAVPAVHAVAASKLFERGIYARSGDALERLATVDHVIFDKTGTLTEAKFTLTNAEAFNPDVLGLAGALAAHSRHPLSVALRPYARALEITDITETPGKGLSGIWNQKTLKLGSAEFVGAKNINANQSSVWFHLGDDSPIHLQMSDQLRGDALETINELKALGFSQEMVTGDNSSMAREVAELLGLKHWKASIKPKGKLDIIESEIAAGKKVLMIGDGINDAPALASATASVSLASASDISRTASDIVLQNDKLSNLPFAIKIAKSAQRRVSQNLWLAVIYNLFAIPLAVFGLVNPLIAALAMSGSSLIVTLNALRVSPK